MSENTRPSWRAWLREPPPCVEVRRCSDKSRGNGLFATKNFQPGADLYYEDPVPGTAILMFDEKEASSHCSHCTAALSKNDSRSMEQPCECENGCGTSYCSVRCRQESWHAHHEILCSVHNNAWADFETQAKECANEYYIMAARAVASLRHEGDNFMVRPESLAHLREDRHRSIENTQGGKHSVRHASDFTPHAQEIAAHDRNCSLNQLAPWSDYAAPPWWYTLRRPTFGSSGSISCGRSSRSRSSGSEASCTGRPRDCRSLPSHRMAGFNADSALTPRTDDGLMPDCATSQKEPRRSIKVSANNVQSNGTRASSSQSIESSADSSLDRFFVAKVKEQTGETVDKVRQALKGVLRPGGLPDGVLGNGAEGLARLIGLMRVNALSVQSAQNVASESHHENSDRSTLRGMAIYAVTSAMNHSFDPNCFVASDPEVPYRCVVRVMRPIFAGDELCINYLEGSPYSKREKHGILRWQYGIV